MKAKLRLCSLAFAVGRTKRKNRHSGFEPLCLLTV